MSRTAGGSPPRSAGTVLPPFARPSPHALLCALLLRLVQLAGAWDFVVEVPYMFDIVDVVEENYVLDVVNAGSDYKCR